MTSYRHTQPGYAILVSLAAVVPVCIGLAMRLGDVFVPLSWTVLGVLAVMAVLFSSLTVEVESSTIQLRFGPGLIRKAIPLDEVRGCRIVRNPWQYGWGIHLTPRGWLYNVSGFAALELDLPEGRHLRIGTDEPEKLYRALSQRLDLE